MKISPIFRPHKASYPTLATLSAGAVILVGGSCQQQSKQYIGGKFPVAISTTGNTDSASKKQPGKANTKPKQTPQIVIGRARIVPHND